MRSAPSGERSTTRSGGTLRSTRCSERSFSPSFRCAAPLPAPKAKLSAAPNRERFALWTRNRQGRVERPSAARASGAGFRRFPSRGRSTAPAAASRRSPPFFRRMHRAYLTCRANDRFRKISQGECADCHETDVVTRARTIPSGREEQRGQESGAAMPRSCSGRARSGSYRATGVRSMLRQGWRAPEQFAPSPLD